MANNTVIFGGSPGYTVKLTSTIDAGTVAGRFIKSDVTGYASTNDLSCGVTIGGNPGDTVAADNEIINCQVTGVVSMQAGAAIAAFAKVESDANGKAITLSAGILRGVALDEATGDGDIIRVLITTLNGTVA